MTVQIQGVKETIRELSKIDPEIRRSFNKNVKAIVKPAIVAAQQKYKSEPYPSGTARNWQQGGRQKFPLSGDQAARGVKTSIKTAKKNQSTILVVNANAGAVIFEFANAGALGSAFRDKNGRPARTLWPSVNARMPDIVGKMTDLVQQVEREIDAQIRGK
jgi:hypothetical protein